MAKGYDTFYAAWGGSPTLRRIWREHVTGEDYPELFEHISFLSLDELRSLSERLELSEGDLLVDLACGAGGPGLWVAKESRAKLVGLDLSPIAVERASERARVLAMSDTAVFRQGTFEATALDEASVDAVMTVDALQYAPSKTAALAEIARIVRPGGRFAMVAFELDVDRVAGLPVWEDPVSDYRPILERVGFDLVVYDQLPRWQERVAAGFGAILAQREMLEAELGEAAAAALVLEAAVTIEIEPYSGHVLAVATRRYS
jgi:ubiquinone/menaquinone biosynthesis C-methylase UbiE